MDDLVSRTGKVTGKDKKKIKKSMEKAQQRLRQRIHNLVDEVHRKTVMWLVQRFDVILLPDFRVSQMVAKEESVINSMTRRNMLTWRHYQFKQRLLAKAEEYGKVVKIVSEGMA